MVSQVDICNLALQNIGADPISDIDEDSPEASECKLRYDSVRRALLRDYFWNFAIKRVELPLSTETPAFGYANKFGLPADYMRIVGTDKQLDTVVFGTSFNGFLTIQNRTDFALADDFKIEDGFLLSDDESKKIAYVYDAQEPEKFDDMFVEMFGFALAAAIAFRITNSRTLADDLNNKLKEMKQDAKKSDGQEGVNKRIERSMFVAVRTI